MKDLQINNRINPLDGEFSKTDSLEFECELEKDENKLFYKDLVLINHLIDLQNQKFNCHEGFKSFESQISKPKSKPFYFVINNYTSLLKYAAILIAVFSISHFIFQESQTDSFVELKVPAGDRSYIELPDGTAVWLNSNSVLKYASNFYNEDDRKVYLQGEAFFDVVKNPKKPFVVSLDSSVKIEVLGTTFNVKAYAEDTHITTTLLTGEIDLSYKEDKDYTNKMVPGDKADFEKEKNKMFFEKIDSGKDVVAWKDKRLVFKKENLRNIVNEINRFYDVEVIIADKSIERYEFTASFKKDIQLEEVFTFLSLSGDLKCKKITSKKWEIIRIK